MNIDKLQSYLLKLSGMLESDVDAKEPTSEENLIERFDKVAETFRNGILSDATLTDSEKKDVILASIVAVNILNDNISYVAQIHYLTSDDAPVTRGIFSWLTKPVKCAIGIVGTFGGAVLNAYVPVAGELVAAASFTLAVTNCTKKR